MRSYSPLSLLLLALALSACVASTHAASHSVRGRLFRPPQPQAGSPDTFTAPSWTLARATSPNLRPIVGIVSLANSDSPDETKSSISAAYVKWLEQAGARVAVVPFNAPHDVLDQLFDGINGLLFTGGGLSLDADSLYFKQALYLFNKAKEANDAGDFFPIWGTCQGFQLLNLLAALPEDHASILKCNAYDSTNIVLPLDFSAEAPTSLLYGPAQKVAAFVDGSSSESIYDVLAKRNVTMNLHNCGVSPEDFNNNPVLPSFYYSLSTNVDLRGKPFISTIQGRRYPFIGTQYHSERVQFEWDFPEKLNHEGYSIAVASYISQRFMGFVRKSQHKFPSVEAETAALIYMYTPTYNGDNPHDTYPAQQVYYFDFKY